MLIVLAAGCVAPTARAAENCANLVTLQEVFEAVSSKDQLTVLKGLTCGLQSEDRGARGLVIYKYLSDGPSAGSQNTPARSVINVVVEAFPSDKDAAEAVTKLPSFSFINVLWSPNGHQFTGDAGYGTTTAGNLIEDMLTITYRGWPISNAKGEATRAECVASLSPNEHRTALEGTLRCSGLPYRFKISLGI